MSLWRRERLRTGVRKVGRRRQERSIAAQKLRAAEEAVRVVSQRRAIRSWGTITHSCISNVGGLFLERRLATSISQRLACSSRQSQSSDVSCATSQRHSSLGGQRSLDKYLDHSNLRTSCKWACGQRAAKASDGPEPCRLIHQRSRRRSEQQTAASTPCARCESWRTRLEGEQRGSAGERPRRNNFRAKLCSLRDVALRDLLRLSLHLLILHSERTETAQKLQQRCSHSAG